MQKRTVVYSDLWYTALAIYNAVYAYNKSSGVIFDPTTDVDSMSRLESGRIVSFEPGTDFLSIPDTVELHEIFTNLGKMSFQNSPYSKLVGGAGVFVDKHLAVCQHNGLHSMNLLNACTGAKWFHKILNNLEKAGRPYSVGIVEGRINFEAMKVEWTLDGEVQVPKLLPMLQTHVNKGHEVVVTKNLQIEPATQPRYDNILLMVGLEGESTVRTQDFILDPSFHHNVKWLSL